MTEPNAENPRRAVPDQAGAVRTLAGGALMGVANIIPGVSGGTMILAMGLYEQFVEAVADVTRLRFRMRSIVFLGLLGVAALIAILATVDVINWGLANHQHVMFALFIGLTLGGVPLILEDLRPLKHAAWGGALGGLVLMIFVTFLLGTLQLPANFLFLFIGGIVGSAAMVLPGISGSYLLLAMGLYAPITFGISDFKEGLQAGDFAAMLGPAFGVILPVGLGVVAGIAGLTNLLKRFLEKYHDGTMGLLLGMLLGSVYFLYPFKEPGRKDPFAEAAPMSATNIALVLICIAFGYSATYMISHLGNGRVRKSP